MRRLGAARDVAVVLGWAVISNEAVFLGRPPGHAVIQGQTDLRTRRHQPLAEAAALAR